MMNTLLLNGGALAVGVAAPLALWALLGARPPAHKDVVRNLTRGMSTTDPNRHHAVSKSAGRFLRRYTPAHAVARIDRVLTLAGRPSRWTIERIMVAKMVLLGAVLLLNMSVVNEATSGLNRLLFAVFIVVAFFVPELVLYGRGVERQKVIERQVPDTLDQMTISVEAGLGFDAAMARAASNGKGPLCDELVRTLQELQVGVPRREAYMALAERTTVSDLRRFVSALLQADTYGIPLADILRTQAAEIRLKRRQRAEQRAMQIPVKVVFPLVLFILPALFIVVLGPAAMDIARAFG